jgi:uncharacterized protein (TIGR02300 family)
MFFFEKKNQKTLLVWAEFIGISRSQTAKSFWLLCFKKEVLVLLRTGDGRRQFDKVGSAWHSARPLAEPLCRDSMAKPELGHKRVCVSCGARFYDLTKAPAVCPKCGTEQPIEQPRAPRRGGNVAEDRKVKKAPVLEDADTDAEVEVAEEEADESVLEDTSDLDDDADAIGGDLEVEPDSDEGER